MKALSYTLVDFRRDCGWNAAFHVDQLPALHEEVNGATGKEERFTQETKNASLWPHFFPVEGQAAALTLFASHSRRDVGLLNFIARTMAMNPLLSTLPTVYSPSGVSVFLWRAAGNPLHKRVTTPPGFIESKFRGLPTVVTRGLGEVPRSWECSLWMPSHDRSLLDAAGAICGCLFGSLPLASQQLKVYQQTEVVEAAIFGGSRDVLAILLNDNKEFNLYTIAQLYSAAAQMDDMHALKALKARIPADASEAEIATCATSESDSDVNPLTLALRHNSPAVTEYLLDRPTYFDDPNHAEAGLVSTARGDNVDGFQSLVTKVPGLKNNTNALMASLVVALRRRGEGMTTSQHGHFRGCAASMEP